MKLVVFSENNGLRKYIEDMLTSTPYNFQSLGLGGMLARGGLTGFDGILVDFQTWQRCAVFFRYFGVLEEMNSKPVIVFNKGKKAPALKFRSIRPLTAYCGFPPQTEELHSALQQMSSALVGA